MVFKIQAAALIGCRPLVAATKDPDKRNVPEPSTDGPPVVAVNKQFVATKVFMLYMARFPPTLQFDKTMLPPAALYTQASKVLLEPLEITHVFNMIVPVDELLTARVMVLKTPEVSVDVFIVIVPVDALATA